jgi:hypothetical protein
MNKTRLSRDSGLSRCSERDTFWSEVKRTASLFSPRSRRPLKNKAQGARLTGIYDSQIAFGQLRLLLVLTRLIMPNGGSIVLERQHGADAGGHAGLEDEVDNHRGEMGQGRTVIDDAIRLIGTWIRRRQRMRHSRPSGATPAR